MWVPEITLRSWDLAAKPLYPAESSWLALRERHFSKRKKKMFFKRETILIKVVRLGRWSNVFPKMILLLNGFMVGEAAGLCSLLGVVMTEPAP